MSKMSFENHIMKQFDEELEEIRTRLMEMGGKVEQQLQNAVRAVSEADSALAELVIKEEKLVDEMEVDIDEACILIIARRQPAASDLRLVMMVTKAVNDLERIGDEAKKIANHAVMLAGESTTSEGYTEVRHMGKSVISMLNNAPFHMPKLNPSYAYLPSQTIKMPKIAIFCPNIPPLPI